jgi:ATP-dependent helicase/nuclease subunit A
MTNNAALKTEVDNPGLRQSQAANPMKSHWVGASAGTGKTKVLIDRVLRLMLPRQGMAQDSAKPP